MKLYVIVVENRKDFTKTLLSVHGQVAVFDSHCSAMDKGFQEFGDDNPNVTFKVAKLEATETWTDEE